MELVIVALLAVVVGLLAGWLLGGRRAGGMASDLAVARSRIADADLMQRTRDAVEAERNAALRDLAAARAQGAERHAAFEATTRELAGLRDIAHELSALKAQTAEREAAHAEALRTIDQQFGSAATKVLERAQAQFLDRAHQRFAESEATQGQHLAALLQPVNERLRRYEEGVAKVEAERRDAFGMLHGQIEALRTGQERVSGEAAKLVNALRNAPKARGRWGEQQLRNVLEACGLSQHADFAMEVSVADGEGGRLRPDAIVRVPGGKALVIDAKVSLNAYQDACGAVDDAERLAGLAAHAASMRAHVNGLGNKAYWAQFDDAPDYVIMFVPGEHFLSAALEHDPTLWDFAFDRRVLLATPTNLIAIARTVSAVWRQERLASQAREIGALGKELYARLAVMGGHVSRLGKNLDTAMTAYNAFVGSLESNVLTQAKRFEALDVDTGNKSIDSPPVIEQQARPLTKLPRLEEAAE